MFHRRIFLLAFQLLSHFNVLDESPGFKRSLHPAHICACLLFGRLTVFVVRMKSNHVPCGILRGARIAANQMEKLVHRLFRFSNNFIKRFQLLSVCHNVLHGADDYLLNRLFSYLCVFFIQNIIVSQITVNGSNHRVFQI